MRSWALLAACGAMWAAIPPSAGAFELRDAPQVMPRDISVLAGTYEPPGHPGFAPFDYVGGAMLYDHIGLDYYSDGTDTIVMAKWQLPSGDGPATWMITGAVEAGRIGDGQALYLRCEHRQKNIFVSTFAIGEVVDGAETDDLDRVWDVNSRDGTISETSPSGVTCINEGM